MLVRAGFVGRLGLVRNRARGFVFDLSAGQFPQGFNLARASAAAYFNTSAVLVSVANNTARIDTNPSTLAPRGLLLEPQRTNLLLYSQEFDGNAYAKNNSATVTANTTLAPDATMTADTISMIAAISSGTYNATFQGIANAVPVTAGQDYTYSVFLSPLGANQTILFGSDSTTAYGSSTAARATFNLSNQTISGAGAQVKSSGIQSLQNGWYRIWVTVTALNNAANAFWTFYNASASQTGTWAIWGGQVEQGPLSSYIFTAATTVTRAVDLATISSVAASGLGAAEGTIIATLETAATGAMGVVCLDDGTSDNRILMRVTSGGAYNVQIRSGGVDSVNSNDGSITAGSVQKLGLAYANGNIAFVANGGTVVTSNAAVIPTVNAIRLGNNLGGSEPFQGWVVRLAFYATRLPDAQLQAMTA